MWVVYIVVSAVLESFSSIYRKIATKNEPNFHLIPILSIAASLPIAAVIALPSLSTQAPVISVRDVLLIAAAAILGAGAIVSRYKAIHIADVSKIEPLASITPAVIVVTSFVFLRELPPPIGIAGVLLVVLGTIVINLPERQKRAAKTSLRKNIASHKAALFMLIAVAIWSVTGTIDKSATKTLSIPVYVLLVQTGVELCLLVYYRPNVAILKKLAKNKGLPIAAIGITGTIALVFQTMAVQHAYVSYVASLKRLDILLVVVMGHFWLKEGSFKRRFIGAACMLAGILLITHN